MLSMRYVAYVLFGVLCLTAVDGQRADAATLSIAIIDYQDTWTSTKGLGDILGDLGYAYTDITANLVGGSPLDLTGFNTFIIGSFCTQNETILAAVESGETTMHSFVDSGGTIIMLTQADQNRISEDWLEPPALAGRCDADFDDVKQIRPTHQVFNSPNSISEANLYGWRFVSDQWRSSWESFNLFQQVGVLAGDHSAALTMATIIETGWGQGRALLLSMAVDKARNVGNTQAKTQAPRLMRNLLQYANDVQDGTVEDIIIYTGPGYSGPIQGVVFNDLNDNGTRDEGEPGIEDVVGVSESIDLVTTNSDGSYTLPNAAGNATILYISIPSGYSKKATWYRAIDAGSSGGDFDFALRTSDESGPFEFVQMTDIHVGNPGSNRTLYTNAIAQMCQLTNPPGLLIATGDLVESGAVTTQYDDYVAAIATSTVPVFNVFGNHDVNDGRVSNYRNYLGPDYYSFSYGDCHFLVVNSIYRTAQQNAWIAADIAALRGDKKLFIFQHYSPSQSEHSEFASYQAEAVFTGHWHSQHSVEVGDMRSYNSQTLVFGGIDCSPAGFKIISVNGDGITTRTRFLANGKRLQIVTPNDSMLVARKNIRIIVNAYETSSDITSVTYSIKRGTQEVAAGSLDKEGQWSWVAMLSVTLPAGPYTISVTATNDKAEINTTSAGFSVKNRKSPTPTIGADWPQFGGGPKRGGLVTGATIAPPLGLVWIADTEGTIDFGSPVLYQGTVYIGVKDRGDFDKNGVLALNAATGTRQWFTSMPAAVSHSVAVDASRVYANSHGGLLHFLNRADGQEQNAKTLGSAYQRFLYGSPVIQGNRVYSGTYAYFAAFDTATAQEQWNRSYGVDWVSCNASPATDGNTVVVPANWVAQGLRAVSAVDGGVIWIYDSGSGQFGLNGSPVITGDRVVFSTYNGQLIALSLANGNQIWSKTMEGKSATTPAVSGNTVVAGGTGSVKAYRLDNGDPLWTFAVSTSALTMSPYKSDFGSLIGSPTIVGSTVYVPAGDGRLYALSLSNGSQQWSMNFGTPILSAPCISGNMLFITTYDGHVYALTDISAFGPPISDFDGDNDVDQEDFGYFQACLSGSGYPQTDPNCASAILDNDTDVDANDFTIFYQCISGADKPADPDCVD